MKRTQETEAMANAVEAGGNGGKAKKSGGKSVRNLVLLGLLLVGLAIGIPTWWSHHNHESTDDAQVEGHIISISPRMMGLVTSVRVIDNQPVKAGDTLFTLDDREMGIKLQLAEADLIAAEAAAKGGIAGAGAQAAQSQKSTAQANLDAAKSNLSKAKKDLDRVRELFQKDIVSKAQLDAAEAAFQSAQAAYAAASEVTRGTAYGIAGANAQVRAADARLLAAQAAVDAARLQLSYTAVTAPAPGHVEKVSLEPGQQVAVGQPVMAIVDAAPVWVVANLKETQLARVHPGLKAEIDVDAYPGRTVTGTVSSIQYATGARFSLLPPDNASGNFTKVVQRIPVRIDLPPEANRDEQHALRPGMSVSVSIDIRQGG
ncbi:MAG: secretion protein HlyD family protein [Fibrobacteres bacterium]|nr:secretion protein HlyD family protein [Fibrobacterota bacterium]